MADVSRSSNLEEDPLHAYSGLSLFPRTLKSLWNPLPPRLYQSDDLQQTHTLLESMPFDIQNEHQEQAKAILDESSELLKQGIGTSVASEDMNVGVKMNPANKRERRPGLDRKRGHFSLKLTTSQPPPSGPTFDGSKYPRPEDYFAEYEIFESAGTKFESGVRRSTRIKSRPLEYWRGERFLFGRIHESLATVIGIKYGSPGDGKSEKRASKVKSFVSDDYKELVDLAALH